METSSNYAFIDTQNLYLSAKGQNWSIDWKKFRFWLDRKYSIKQACVFIGYVAGNSHLYTKLQSAGFICVFKDTYELPDGTIKGNVDAELVLHASAVTYCEYNKAIVITGDGDFLCLLRFLQEHNKLLKCLTPHKYHYSKLLKKIDFETNQKFLEPLSDHYHKFSDKLSL